MKKYLNIIAAATITLAGFSSCSDVEIPENPAADLAPVSNLTANVEGRGVTLNWTLSSSSVTGIQVLDREGIVASLEGAQTSYFIKRAPVGDDLTYMVRPVYGNLVAESRSVTFSVTPVEAKPAYLVAYNSVAEIEDDDEKASCEWFRNKYPNGELLYAPSLPQLSPEDYSCIMIHIDRKYIGWGWTNLPQSIINDEVLNNLRNYAKEGGNLLLWTHATQLTVPLGRIDDKYAPGVFGDGDGGFGYDNWNITAIWGAGMDVKVDRRDHVLWNGITTCNDFAWETYPIIGTGNPETGLWREDHNCMWDPNAEGFAGNGSPDNIPQFEEALNCTALGTWGHVADYCCVAVVDFKPTSEFLGRIVAVGGAAFEWNPNEGTNAYQGNIERFAENAFSYMK